MSFNKTLFAALIGALALGLYFSNNKIEAQVKSCAVSLHSLENVLLNLSDSELALSSLRGSLDEFQLSISDEKISLADSTYLLDGAKMAVEDTSASFADIKRALEAQLIACAPYAK